MQNEAGLNDSESSKIQNPKSQFDPITLEILWRRLVSIVDEADASVARTAFSSLLRDAHDYTCMFTDSRGQELVQGTFCTPGQAGAMALGVKNLINTVTLEAYRPGGRPPGGTRSTRAAARPADRRSGSARPRAHRSAGSGGPAPPRTREADAGLRA